MELTRRKSSLAESKHAFLDSMYLTFQNLRKSQGRCRQQDPPCDHLHEAVSGSGRFLYL